MTFSLERSFDHKEAILQSIHPRELWIELAPERGVRQGIATEIVTLPGYPAATWAASGINWPSDGGSELPAAPEVEAWRDPDRPAQPGASLQSGRDFQSIGELRGRVVQLAGGTVIVESVSMETHTVMIGPERRSQQPCLVVRIDYSPELPVRVRLDADLSDPRSDFTRRPTNSRPFSGRSLQTRRRRRSIAWNSSL